MMAADPAVKNCLLSGFRSLFGKDPEDAMLQHMLAYLELLERWNRTYNLTAVRQPIEMVGRHLLDSLSIMPWLKGASLLDAGTGAGLPGIPLAIMRPEMQVTLLDSAGKKIRFLRHVKRELKMDNILPCEHRLESYTPEDLPDVIVSRAFSSLSLFANSSRHLLHQKSELFAMKGQLPEDEISGLPDWIGVNSVEKLSVPGLHEQRHLVIMSLNE